MAASGDGTAAGQASQEQPWGPGAPAPAAPSLTAASAGRGDEEAPCAAVDLWEAAARCDAARVRRLLEALSPAAAAAAVATTNEDGDMLLHHLCCTAPVHAEEALSRRDVFGLLLEARAEVNAANESDESPLMLAARSASDTPSSRFRLASVSALLELRADPNLADPEGETALMEAACVCDPDLCALLLGARADPSLRCAAGSSALDLAERSPALLAVLLEGRCAEAPGAPRSPEARAAPAAHRAGGALGPGGRAAAAAAREEDAGRAAGGHAGSALGPGGRAAAPAAPVETSGGAAGVPVAERLRAALEGPDGGAAADAVLLELRREAGTGATKRGLGGLLREACGADGELLLRLVELPSPAGMTAEAVEWLLAAGADPNFRNVLGETALALAARAAPSERALGLARQLLGARADPDAADAQGETVLMEAVCGGGAPLCELLLAARADPRRESDAGMSCMDLAVGHPDAAVLVEALGAALRPTARPAGTGEEAAAPPAGGGARCAHAPETFHLPRGDPEDVVEPSPETAEQDVPSDGPDEHQAGWPAPLSPDQGVARRLQEERCSSPPSEASAEDRAFHQKEWERVEDEEEPEVAAPAARGPEPRQLGRGRPAGGGCGEEWAALELVESLRRSAARHLPGEASRLLGRLRGRPGEAARLLALQDADGNTALHLAVHSLPHDTVWLDAAETVELLAEEMSDLNARNCLGETPLLLATRAAAAHAGLDIQRGANTVIESLLDSRADPGQGDCQGETALMEAACAGNAALCRMLLRSRADPAQASSSNLTAADFAASAEVASLLAEARGDAGAGSRATESSEDATSTGEAATPPPPEVAPSRPVQAAAPPAAAPLAEPAAAAPLPAAARAPAEPPRTWAPLLLARARAGPEAPRAPGPPAARAGRLKAPGLARLLAAVEALHPQGVAEALAEPRPSDVASVEELLDFRDADGHSLLHLCLVAPRTSAEDAGAVHGVAAALLRAGARADAASLRGETPLLLAVRESDGSSSENCVQLLNLLLDHRADPNLADLTRVTPLMEAIRCRAAAAVDTLLSRGADAFLRGGPAGETAFEALCSADPARAERLAQELAAGASAPEACAQAAGAGPPGGAAWSRRRCVEAMLRAVEAHCPARVREVLSLWQRERWPPDDLLGWTDHDGNGWLHLGVLAPPPEQCWAPLAAVVGELVAAGAAADRPNSRGETPFLLAVQEAPAVRTGREGLLRALLEAGAPGAAAAGGVLEAAAAGDEAAVRGLLRARASTPGRRAAAARAVREDVSALRREVVAHNSQKVTQLCREEWVKELDLDGNSLLHLCVLSPAAAGDAGASQAATVEALLARRADPAAVNGRGQSPLLLAAEEAACQSGPGLTRGARTLAALLRGRADVDQADRRGRTALMEACAQDNAALARWLIDRGASVRLLDAAGRAAAALAPPGSEAARVAAPAGPAGLAKPAGARRGRPTSLAEAVRSQDAEALAKVLESCRGSGREMEATLAEKDADGNGLLHLCILAPGAHSGRPQLAGSLRALLDARADANARNAQGETPLLLAVREMGGQPGGARLRAVSLLLAAGCGVDIGDHEDTTPLVEAVTLGDAAICQQLLDHGADPDVAGAGGLSAAELASTSPQLHSLFEAQGASRASAGESTRPTARVTLRHAATALECGVPVAVGATVRELKKRVARRCGRGRWRRIALLSEAGRCLHDSEFLNGRSLFLVAGADSPEARRAAAEEELPEEQRWQRWSAGELREEAIRRGLRGEGGRDQLLESLTQVGRWERLGASELAEACLARRIPTEGHGSKKELLNLLRQDLEWDIMPEGALLEELRGRGIALPQEPAGDARREAALGRLRQVLRWEAQPTESLRGACWQKRVGVEGMSREELLAVLRSFAVPRPAEAPAEAAAAGGGGGARSSGAGEEAHAPGAAWWAEPGLTGPRRSASAGPGSPPGARPPAPGARAAAPVPAPPAAPPRAASRPAPAAAAAPPPAPPRAASRPAARPAQPGRGARPASRGSPSPRARPEEPDTEAPSYHETASPPLWLSDRLRRVAEKYPNFAGAWPREMEDWSNADLEMYFYSNGFLKPNKSKKNVLPKALRRNYLRALDLADGASANDVRRAYRRLALQWHPDKNPECPEQAADRFRELSEAYEALSAAFAAEASGAASG